MADIHPSLSDKSGELYSMPILAHEEVETELEACNDSNDMMQLLTSTFDEQSENPMWLFSSELDTSQLSSSLFDHSLNPVPQCDLSWSDLLGEQPDTSPQHTAASACTAPQPSNNMWTKMPPITFQFERQQSSTPSFGWNGSGDSRDEQSQRPRLPVKQNLSRKRQYSTSNASDFSATPVDYSEGEEGDDDDCKTLPCRITDRTEGFLNNEDLVSGRPGQRLYLTNEERRILQQMGVSLPSHFPLTSGQEKALKTARRKIRNKLSAQASRIKRQEYVINLEERLERFAKENARLRRLTNGLENDKKDLLAHVRKLRAYVTRAWNGQQSEQTTPTNKSKRSKPLLPLVIDSAAPAHKPSGRLSASAAAAATGGTSLLLVFFIMLAWTALMPSPALRHALLASTSAGKTGLPVLPGRSRTLLESQPANLGSNDAVPNYTVETAKYLDNNHSTGNVDRLPVSESLSEGVEDVYKRIFVHDKHAGWEDGYKRTLTWLGEKCTRSV